MNGAALTEGTQIKQINADFFDIGRGGACPHPIPAMTALVRLQPFFACLTIFADARCSMDNVQHFVEKNGK